MRLDILKSWMTLANAEIGKQDFKDIEKSKKHDATKGIPWFSSNQPQINRVSALTDKKFKISVLRKLNEQQENNSIKLGK